MARARVIDPRILDSPVAEKLGAAGTLFLIGMILTADDDGRMRGGVIHLKRTILGGCSARTTVQHVEHWLSILGMMGTAYAYDGPDGQPYVMLVNWHKYQKVRHKKASQIPPPPDSNPPKSAEKCRQERRGVGEEYPTAADSGRSDTTHGRLSEPQTSPAGIGENPPAGAGDFHDPASAPVDPNESYDDFLARTKGKP